MKNEWSKSFYARWISEGIGESYKLWYNKADAQTKTGRNSSTPSIVLIKSSTGTGKTTFILDKLALYAADNNRDIVYFGNRIALNEQLKAEAKKRFCEIPNTNQNDISQFIYNERGNRLALLNYQSVNRYNSDLLAFLRPYYVIFDEAHFFVEDALFNKKTYSNFNKLLKIFPYAALIFMTATPANFEYIFYNYVTKAIITHKVPDIYDIISTKNFFKYENIYFPSCYKPLAYSTKEEILYAMNNAPKNEKWLIFVNSVRDGKDYLEKIKLITNKKAKLLTADNKKGAVWETLIYKNCFKCDVLIVTRVIDSGVNIHDTNVKHIVLPFCSEADFSQMLGRRRIEGDETIKIYVEDISIQRINSKYNQLRRNLDILKSIAIINALPASDKKIKSERLQATLFNAKRKSYTNYISLKNSELIYNPFAYYKLKTLEQFYLGLKNSYKSNPDFYLMHIRQWLRTEKKINHIFSEDCDNLISFLEHFKNMPISEQDTEEFYNAFQYYYKRYCVEKFKDNSEILEKALNIRKGKTQRKATINKSLEIIELPYKLNKHNRAWIIS